MNCAPLVEIKMKKLLIIADDLSGAADCGAAFADYGLCTDVLLDGLAVKSHEQSTADILSIDADTRRLLPTEAARVQRAIWQQYYRDAHYFFKKIDSTLRGNVAAELAAIVPQAGVAIVAPAFPSAGRTTQLGRLYVHGVAVEDTEIWQREHLTGQGDLVQLFEAAGVRSGLITTEVIRAGRVRLLNAMEALAFAGHQVIICDAETEQDLQAIAQVSLSLVMPHFWVGSAGLARALAGSIAAKKMLPSPEIQVHGAILTVVGSVSGISCAQAEHLCLSPEICHIALPVALLRQMQLHPQWHAVQTQLANALMVQQDVLLTITAEPDIDLEEGLFLATALGQLVSPYAGAIGAVIATGGETARAVLKGLRVTGLRLIEELETGIPLSLTVGSDPLVVVTKAGAFGDHKTLSQCYARVRECKTATVMSRMVRESSVR
jgi:uncharacterized protein YgbK (DUF1537 family)